MKKEQGAVILAIILFVVLVDTLGKSTGLFVGKIDGKTPLIEGVLHVSYWDGTNEDLKYAQSTRMYAGNCGPQQSWLCQTIDSLGSTGEDTSIAMDKNGVPHISYRDINGLDLKYASFVGNGGNCGANNNWQCDTIDSLGDTGIDTSLVFDNNGIPHISYYFAGLGDLKHAFYVGNGNGNCGPLGSWRCETIDNSGTSVGMESSISIDKNNVIHISYWDDVDQKLKYARSVISGGNCGPNNNWQCDTIDGNIVFGDIDLVVDKNNAPHITYFSINQNLQSWSLLLKYATFVGSGSKCGPSGSWSCDAIISVQTNPLSVGYGYASIDVDSNNLPHISYSDYNDVSLGYASPSGVGGNCGPLNSWRCDKIEVVNGYFWYIENSLVIDSKNIPHIVYFDAKTPDLDLRYTKNVGANKGNCGPNKDWQCDDIDQQGIVGNFNSIAFSRK